VAEYYRVKIDQNKKAYIVDQEGNKLDPERHMEIAETIMLTAQQPRYVYFGWSETKQCHKIGISVDPGRRSGELDIEILFTIKCQMWGELSALNIEQSLHSIFKMAGRHVEREWFHLNKADLQLLNQGDDVEVNAGGICSWVLRTERQLQQLARQECPDVLVKIAETKNQIELGGNAPFLYTVSLELEIIAQAYHKLGYSLIVPHVMYAVASFQRLAIKYSNEPDE
jgi:hypothetical protein